MSILEEDSDDDLLDQEALQAEIEEIDQQIMLLLGVRFRCTDRLAELAPRLGQIELEEAELAGIKRLAQEAGVSPSLGAELLQAVHKARIQRDYERRLQQLPS